MADRVKPVALFSLTVNDDSKPDPNYQNLALDRIMSTAQESSNSNVALPVYQELNQDTGAWTAYSTLDETTLRNNSDGDYTALDHSIVSNGDESAYSRLDKNAC